jgi:hypothetical protein
MVHAVAARTRPGRRQIVAQGAQIDPQERQAQQSENRLSDVWLEQFAKRRHGDADEHKCGNRARALASEPRQRLRRSGGNVSQNRKHAA